MLKYSVSSAHVKCRFLRESGKSNHIFLFMLLIICLKRMPERRVLLRRNENAHRDGPGFAACSLGYWSLAREEWKQGCGDVAKRGERRDYKQKVDEGGRQRTQHKLLVLMIALQAADKGSALSFTCSTLIVTSLCVPAAARRHRNQEQRQNKTPVIFTSQRVTPREKQPTPDFLCRWRGYFSAKKKKEEGGAEGGFEKWKITLISAPHSWVFTSWVGLKVKMARYFLWASLKIPRARGTGEGFKLLFFWTRNGVQESSTQGPAWSHLKTHTESSRWLPPTTLQFQSRGRWLFP